MLTASMRAKWEPLRFTAYTAIVPQHPGDPISWVRVGTKLSYPARIITLSNLTDVSLIFSTVAYALAVPPIAEGEIIIPAQSAKIIDISTNTFSTSITGMFAAPAGTQFWVREMDLLTPPATGGVWLEVVYGEEL